MAEKETIDLLIEGGKASPGPTTVPKLSAYKLNVGEVFKQINEKTKEYKGMKVPVKLIIDKETKVIAKLGKILEDYFGVSQDIEWAIDQDAMLPHSVVLLQARPEVVVREKTPVDQIVDLMLSRFSGGLGFGDGDI